jgi:hypothetical protein
MARLSMLAAKEDSSELQRRATCLAYLAALLAMYKAPMWIKTRGLNYTLEDEARKRGVPRELLEALVALFFIQMPPQGWVEGRRRWRVRN